MCARSRRHYWNRVQGLVALYAEIKTAMPSLTRGEVSSSGTSKSFGHPAQWASDTAREIARLLNDLEDDLRDTLGHAPPPNEHTTSEARMVDHAWKYISNRFDALCTHPAAGDLAQGVLDLHSRIRGAMGYRRRFRYLPGVPCRACDVVGYMVAGDGEGSDRITCEKCDAELPPQLVEFTIRTVSEERLANLVAEYRHARASQLTKN